LQITDPWYLDEVKELFLRSAVLRFVRFSIAERGFWDAFQMGCFGRRFVSALALIEQVQDSGE